MSKKTLFTSIILFLVITGSYAYSAFMVTGYRNNTQPSQRASAFMVSPEALEIAAGEFKGIIADYLLLKGSVFLGGRYSTTKEDWKAVYTLFSQSLALDPYFFQTCYYVQATLPWEAKMPQRAIELLEISKQHRPWDWQPGFYIGFDYYYFLKDNLNGSKYLMEASEKPGASPLLALLGARLSQKAGETKAGIVFLKTMYENEENEETKKQIKQRIDALKGVLILEKAIEKFTLKLNHSPKKLDELITAEILTALPENPYGDAYNYDYETGIISYDTAL
ncbi:MAG TPA: hypothetical protein DD405_04200 [Desulfobacteraceae bacterium]|nr:hypothetical protein [Desulfobacteraceae bacterium]